MPDPQPTYNDRLIEARRDALGTPNDPSGIKQGVLRRMYEAYARMLVDVQSDVEDELITEERAEALRQSIGRSLQRLEDELVESVGGGKSDVVRAAIEAHRGATAAAAEAAGTTIDVGERWADVPDRVARYALQRRTVAGAETLRTIVRRNLQAVASDIDDAIVSSIGRGVSQQRLMQDLAAQMARQDEALQEVLSQMGQLGRDAAVGDGTTVLDEGDVKRARRLLYDARRIAVSEINSTYDEADKISAAQSPVVDLLRWRTSSRHDGLHSSPDACDVYERQDLHGYGAGLYHPDTVPSLPHPHCMCRVESVLRRRQDWGDPGARRPQPDRPAVERDTIRRIMEDAPGDRSVTDAHVQSQARMIERGIEAVYDQPRG